MEKTLITIGRQHGSGGTEVAEILAEKLNVWYYNREILYMAADKIGFDSFDEESMKELNYRKSSKYMEGLSVMMGTPGHIPVYNKMYKEQGKIIQKLAGYGSGVFLGRCADYILKDFENVYSVFLYLRTHSVATIMQCNSNGIPYFRVWDAILFSTGISDKNTNFYKFMLYFY